MHEIRLRKQIETEAAFDLPFARERLWPILSRTEWLNRAMGLPPVTYEMTKAPGGGSNVKARATFAGLSFVWEERPFQWLENEFYQVERFFESGPLIRANLIWKFEELAKDATRLRVISQFEARNPLCGFLMKHLLDPKATRDVARVVRHFEEHLRGDQPIALPKLATRPVAEAAFESALGKLRASGQRPELVGKLAAMVREAPDIFAARIRPFAVAKSWGMDEWEVLRLFLHATRAGLLSLSWEVLCPNCRLTRQPLTDSLAEVKQAMHCESCQINYDAEFDKSVELRFAVHPGVRACDTNTFCLAGPGARPHIVAQIHLLPGETRAWPWPKEAALYRLRSPQIAQSRTIEPTEFAKWRAGSFALSAEKIESVEGNSLEVENRFTHPVQLVLERMESAEPILTASRVTNWQEFRDLFAREVISPREQIVVGEQIILFTDLRGSTAMYCGIGDAPAYALVREHFGVLQAAISEFSRQRGKDHWRRGDGGVHPRGRGSGRGGKDACGFGGSRRGPALATEVSPAFGAVPGRERQRQARLFRNHHQPGREARGQVSRRRFGGVGRIFPAAGNANICAKPSGRGDQRAIPGLYGCNESLEDYHPEPP